VPVRSSIHDTIETVCLIRPTRVTDATPVVSTVGGLNCATRPPGARYLLVLTSFETNSANTGGVFAIEASATSGGTYSALATLGSDSLTIPADVTTVITRERSFVPDPLRPFVRVMFTGADANAEVDVTAHAIVLRRAMV
jgi:hypothetical protein